MQKMLVQDKKIGKYFYINFREGTKDESAIKEVCFKKEYMNQKVGMIFERGESWLDLGGHIGSFTRMLNMNYGCRTTTYEPEEDNFEMLKLNTLDCDNAKIFNSAVTLYEENEIQFYRPTKMTDTYKFTTIKNARPFKKMNNTNAKEVFSQKFDGCKMDIEGAEHSFIDSGILPNCDKLVMEYHLTKDREMKNFYKRMDILRDFFEIVHHRGYNEKYLKNGRFIYGQDPKVYCLKRK